MMDAKLAELHFRMKQDMEEMVLESSEAHAREQVGAIKNFQERLEDILEGIAKYETENKNDMLGLEKNLIKKQVPELINLSMEAQNNKNWEILQEVYLFFFFT